MSHCQESPQGHNCHNIQVSRNCHIGHNSHIGHNCHTYHNGHNCHNSHICKNSHTCHSSQTVENLKTEFFEKFQTWWFSKSLGIDDGHLKLKNCLLSILCEINQWT